MERCVGGAAETDADAACGRDDDATMTESEAAAPIGLTSCRDVETADKLIGPDWHHISGPFDVHLRDGKSRGERFPFKIFDRSIWAQIQISSQIAGDRRRPTTDLPTRIKT